MSDLPIVSVIVPCLNRARFLRPTLDSILAQDYPSLECIVMDGGSKDGTIEILRSYGDRIRWFSQADKGQADAINKGWALSQGEILAWLNADDVWAVPGAVSQAVAFFKQNPDVDLVYGDCGVIDTEGKLLGMSYLQPWDLEYAVRYCDHCIPQPASFIRRRILEKVGWLDSTFMTKMDHELWLRIGLHGKIQHVSLFLAYARSLPDDTSHQWKTGLDCVRLTKKFFQTRSLPDRLRREKRRALSNAYLRGMNYAWYGNRRWRLIFKYAARAALADIRNAARAYRSLRQFVTVGATEDKALKPVRLALELPMYPVGFLKHLARWLSGRNRPRIPNLLGDREIEWSWIASRIPPGPGQALEFGSGSSPLALLALLKGYEVTAANLQQVQWKFSHPALHSVRGDISKLPLPLSHFDLILNCSTVGHVGWHLGFTGQYGVSEERPDADLEMMARFSQLLKPSGTMVLTIPVGQDEVFSPVCRVYGKERLPILLRNFAVEEEMYWVKNSENRWVNCDRDTATSQKAFADSSNALQNIYALGCFVLRRSSK